MLHSPLWHWFITVLVFCIWTSLIVFFSGYPNFCVRYTLHRENSPVTQTTPEPILFSWGGWPRDRPPPPIVLKSFHLAQVCHGNEICWKLAFWRPTLELAFRAHCISNWKLNGISRTNISKATFNAANERARCSRGASGARRTLPAGQQVGVKMGSGTWKCGPESPVGVISVCATSYVEYNYIWIRSI